MELVLMLYDECILALDRAQEAFDIETPDKIEKINNNILRAQNIITELVVSLDMDKGGEVAENLQRLYDFMMDHLSQANIAKQRQPVIEVRNMMNELRDAWKEISTQEPLGTKPSFQNSGIRVSG